MDAKEYDRIADLLMQIRKKYNKLARNDKLDEQRIQIFVDCIDKMLYINQVIGEKDAKGWL